MSIVTLITDFGSTDIYAGRFKGYLFSEIRNIQIVDITHDIPAFNVIAGAYSLKNTFQCFPKGSYHVIRVNERGITNEGLLIIYTEGHYFIAPDNAVLPMALNNSFDWVRKVNLNYFEELNSDEIYAKVLKSLFEHTYESISQPTTHYKYNSSWAVIKEDNIVRGMVVIIDHFGNLVTNIHISDIAPYLKRFESCTINYREKEAINEIVVEYNEVEEGERLCKINDLGFLEIAINQGFASNLLGIKFGQTVYLEFI